MRGIFAIRDRTANVFSGVNMDLTNDTAKRNFAFSVNNIREIQFASKDYELCRIADFDEVKGVISPVVPIEVICRGDEVIEKIVN